MTRFLLSASSPENIQRVLDHLNRQSIPGFSVHRTDGSTGVVDIPDDQGAAFVVALIDSPRPVTTQRIGDGDNADENASLSADEASSISRSLEEILTGSAEAGADGAAGDGGAGAGASEADKVD